MTREEANRFALSKSEQGKTGMTVLGLGYVYHIIDSLTTQYEEEIKRLKEKYEG